MIMYRKLLLSVLSLAVAIMGMAYEYHETTTKVKHFDWSQYYFTYTDSDGVEQTACLTDEAFTPEHQMALLREVYKNPNIPGIHYCYDYNGTQNRKIDYNQFGHLGQADPGYWLGSSGEVYPNPYEDGMTMLLVQVKDSWSYSMHSSYSGREYFDKAIESIKLMPNFVRVDSDENPGYLFSVNDAVNRFFFISKGKPRYTMVKPFYRLFEQISPVNDYYVDTNAESLINALLAGNDYFCFHDCSNVFSLTSSDPEDEKHKIPHWFTISNKGEAYDLSNLMIFIPDRRFEYQLAPAEYKDVSNQKWIDETGKSRDYFNEYGNSDIVDDTHTSLMPKMMIYTADLEADATPSDSLGFFNINLNWESNLMDGVPEHYFVYAVDNDGKTMTLLPSLSSQPTTEKKHQYAVEQHADPQEFHYVITASPIVLNDDGTIYTDSVGLPVQTIIATSPIRTVIVPGRTPFFSHTAEYRSRYEITKELNVYKNTLSISPTTPTDFLSIKNNLNDYTLTRTDDAGNKTAVAKIRFNVIEGSEDYGYTVVYNGESQDLVNLFDSTLPTLSGTISADNPKVLVIDRFSASTATNSQPAFYVYTFEQDGVPFSNGFKVPVYKTTNSVEAMAVTREDCDDDYDHTLNTIPLTAVTFSAINDPFAGLAEYSIRSLDSKGVDTKVGKAENALNDGVYTKYGTSGENYLNEHQGIARIGDEGGEITINVRLIGSDYKDKQRKYVPVIVTNYDVKKMETNTYGCNQLKVECPYVNADVATRNGVKQVMMTRTLNTWQGLARYYMMEGYIRPYLTADVNDVYRYRVWRVNGDREQGWFTFFDYETPLNDLENFSGQSTDEGGNVVNWGANYSEIQTVYPKSGTIYFTDLFLDEAIVGESDRKTVKYIVRMYAAPKSARKSASTQTLAVDDDRYYLIAEKEFSVRYTVTGTITGMDSLVEDNDVELITYYNTLGVPSQRPFKGVNIVSTRYSNGRVETAKRLFP